VLDTWQFSVSRYYLERKKSTSARTYFSFPIVLSSTSLHKLFLDLLSDPRKAPFLPRSLVGTVARFTFHALTIPLIYSTIAIAVTIESVGNYWFVIAGAFVVIGISYLVATCSFQCRMSANASQDFQALRVAATFPNIVALPILIFPSLCEFPVVYEGYILEEGDAAYLERQCVAQSSTMIFCYFFSWSLAFWSFGNRQLMQAASKRHEETITRNEDKETTENAARNTVSVLNEDSSAGEGGKADAELEAGPSEEGDIIIEDCQSSSVIEDGNVDKENGRASRNEDERHNNLVESSKSSKQVSPAPGPEENHTSILQTVCTAVKQTITSPGFIAMALAFITACIPPLQKALFEGGGPLRFFGSAMETLGVASSPISTMVVAASLVPPRLFIQEEESDAAHTPDDSGTNSSAIVDQNPGMTDPNFGPYQRRNRRQSSGFRQIGRSLRSGSMRMLQAVPRSTPEMLSLHIWFCLSRLVLTPAVVVGLILALDCTGELLSGVPNLAKLVIIVNAALPGALIVIVLLKSKEDMAETAAAVAKVYLPSYLLSIFTIAAWTAIGLWVTLPDSEGHTVCQR
jgi:hypothetical protein